MSEQDAWRIEVYRDERRRSPVDQFIDALDSKMRAKVLKNLVELERLGDRLGMPLARPVIGHRFWELRVQTGGNIVRIFYFLAGGRRAILLHAFVKKDRKTPRAELAIAERRRNDFPGRQR